MPFYEIDVGTGSVTKSEFYRNTVVVECTGTEKEPTEDQQRLLSTCEECSCPGRLKLIWKFVKPSVRLILHRTCSNELWEAFPNVSHVRFLGEDVLDMYKRPLPSQCTILEVFCPFIVRVNYSMRNITQLNLEGRIVGCSHLREMLTRMPNLRELTVDCKGRDDVTSLLLELDASWESLLLKQYGWDDHALFGRTPKLFEMNAVDMWCSMSGTQKLFYVQGPTRMLPGLDEFLKANHPVYVNLYGVRGSEDRYRPDFDALGVGTETELRANYALLEVGLPLGKGKYGEVKAVTMNGKSYAAKFLPTSDKSYEKEVRAEKRFRAIEGVGSQNVNRILVFAYTPGYFVVVMERMQMTYYDYKHGPKWTGRAPDEMIAQLLAGLGFIHRAGLVHNDLHAWNIMVNLDDFHLRIIDLGLSHAGRGKSLDLARMMKFLEEVVDETESARKYAELLKRNYASAEETLEAVREISRNQVLAMRPRMEDDRIMQTIMSFLAR